MRRRILFTLAMSGALLALAPAVALAGHHSPRHHARHHARHHSRVRFERFGTPMPSQPGAGGTDETGTGQENENAGTVASFQNGILTIALRDGTMVTGRVTANTQIECEGPESSSSMRRDDEGRDNGEQGDDAGQAQENDENAEHEEAAQNCSSASLQRDTVVREAELRVSSGGATWDKVELITSTAGSAESEGGES